MTKEGIIKQIKILSSESDRAEVRVFLNLAIKILEMSPRRIEGFVSLIVGFTDAAVHKASSEKQGIQYRKKKNYYQESKIKSYE